MPQSVKPGIGTSKLNWESNKKDSGNMTMVNFIYKTEEAEVTILF
jgi:hypothetical protein